MLNNPNIANNPIAKGMYKNVGSSIVVKYVNQILGQVPYDELFVD